MPNEESDGTFVCPDCDVRPDSVVRWHLHWAACHNVPLCKAIFPPPSAMDSCRQDFRGQWFGCRAKVCFLRSQRRIGPELLATSGRMSSCLSS